MRAPTGDQYELTCDTPAGQARAVITQVAAAIRSYSVAGIDLTEPYDESSTPPSGCGIVLVPWPNRVKDATWWMRDSSGSVTEQRLAVSEPARGNAIHGLLRYSPYLPVMRRRDSITLGATVFPQLGYPFLLDTTVRYSVSAEGLSVQHTIVNAGQQDAPVALGAHPYLKIGGVRTSDLTLRLDATTHFEVDERMNVVAEHPVHGTEFDLRGGRRVSDLQLDDGFGGVLHHGGRGEHSLTAADGRSVTLWVDDSFGYVQAYTHRSFATLPEGEVAIALEPMTAPANALNSGQGLRWLAPGETFTARWGIESALVL
ncbi:aldose 1-epimerase family protein [Planctomonas sp. JC2975]|uniref:aldose 1-epimerase family protein n=1 Tax=Planctomonas sp. JC2975 TaxID=2729626 RepID=UPI001474C439|nr:aldose 1-epimerase family protein [Planctomonas sp. JC2975]NNC11704.1 aldose 1-epimerase family protein [Planctomonas sp. JC2975]